MSHSMPFDKDSPTHSAPQNAIRLVDVFPYRIKSAPEFLIFRRAEGKPYAGQWRMVAGKTKAGEGAWEAALRELKEETGMVPERFWVIPSTNNFYEWETDRVHIIPAFAAQVEGDPQLDDEHDEYMWLTTDNATTLLEWPEHRRLLQLVARMLEDGIPEQLVVHFPDDARARDM
jgi:dihydroneopterin triphosphate diphosphatase